jgi:hypothetical protein
MSGWRNSNGKLIASFVATALTAIMIGWTIGVRSATQIEQRLSDDEARLRQTEVRVASLEAQLLARLDAIEREIALLRDDLRRSTR